MKFGTGANMKTGSAVMVVVAFLLVGCGTESTRNIFADTISELRPHGSAPNSEELALR